jgi:hypothetical protein
MVVLFFPAVVCVRCDLIFLEGTTPPRVVCGHY